MATVQRTQAALQDLMQGLQNTNQRVKVNQWFKESLTDAAVDRLDPQVFGKFYFGLTKSDGSPLDNSDASKAHLRDLGRMISDRQVEQERMQHEHVQLQGERVAQDFMGVMRDRAAAMSKTLGRQVNFWELPPTKEDLAKLQQQNPEAAGMVLTSYMQSVAADQNTQTMKDRDSIFDQVQNKGARFVHGDLSPGDEGDFIQMMLHIRGGDQQLEALQRLRNWGRQNAWGADTPDGLFEVFDRMAKPDPSHPFDLSFIEQMARAGKLSEATTDRLVTHYFNQMGLGDKTPAMTMAGHYGQQIEAQIYDKFISQDPNARPEDVRENIQGRVATAKSQYAESALRYMNSPEFRQASFDDQVKQLKAYADQAAQSNGGFTTGEQVMYHQQIGNRQATPQKPASPVLLKAEPLIGEAKAQGDPALNLLNDDEVARAKAVLDGRKPTLSGREIATLQSKPMRPEDADRQTMATEPVYPMLRARRLLDPDYRRSHFLYGLDYEVPGILGEKVGQDFDNSLAQTYADKFRQTQSQAAAMSSYFVAGGYDRQYRNLLTQLENSPAPDPDAWKQLRTMQNTLIYLSMLRRYAGWTPEEVKAMGGTAWQTHGMFANEQDLYARGKSVMQLLGLNANDPQSVAAFQQKQIELTQKMNHAQ